MERPAINFDETENRYWCLLECDACGGYRHELPAWGLAARPQAHRAAVLARQAHASLGCLACQTLAHRSQIRSDGRTLLYYDALEREWILVTPFASDGQAVTMGLGLRCAVSGADAETQGQLIMGDNPLLLRIIEDGAQVSPTTSAALIRDHHARSWKLWLGCEDCGGAWIPMKAADGAPASAAASEALECLAWVEADGCPNCRRDHFADEDSSTLALWYDTKLHDWMARIPMLDDALVHPLGVHHFSAKLEEVESALDILRLRLGFEPSGPFV